MIDATDMRATIRYTLNPEQIRGEILVRGVDGEEATLDRMEPERVPDGLGYNMYFSDGAVLQMWITRLNDVAEPGSLPEPRKRHEGEWQQISGAMVWVPYEEGE